MLTKLPAPISIVFCNKCQDVTVAEKDKFGGYCSVCRRAFKDARYYPKPEA
jgi:hypothetical protein